MNGVPGEKKLSLRERLPAHDTIAAFQTARWERFEDALTLEGHGRRHGAMYLLGYFVEMTVKIASFRLREFTLDEPLTGRVFRETAAIARKELMVASEPEGYHNISFWVDAIIALRDTRGEPIPRDVCLELAWRGKRVMGHWATSMRYARDLTCSADWIELLEDAQWLNHQFENPFGSSPL